MTHRSKKHRMCSRALYARRSLLQAKEYPFMPAPSSPPTRSLGKVPSSVTIALTKRMPWKENAQVESKCCSSLLPLPLPDSHPIDFWGILKLFAAIFYGLHGYFIPGDQRGMEVNDLIVLLHEVWVFQFFCPHYFFVGHEQSEWTLVEKSHHLYWY